MKYSGEGNVTDSQFNRDSVFLVGSDHQLLLDLFRISIVLDTLREDAWKQFCMNCNTQYLKLFSDSYT